jgi:2-oxoglutarate ferredoxin oxidoreductase subunit gamma
MSGLEVRFSGSGGQGLILSARILSEALVAEGRRVAQSQSFEPTSRGGLSRSDLVVGDEDADYPLVTALDYLIILDQAAAAASDGLIKGDALVLADSRRVTSPPAGDLTLHNLPFSDTAIALGSERVANIVALGALVAMSAVCRRDTVEQILRAETPKGYLDLNLEALNKGFEMAAPAG